MNRNNQAENKGVVSGIFKNLCSGAASSLVPALAPLVQFYNSYEYREKFHRLEQFIISVNDEVEELQAKSKEFEKNGFQRYSAELFEYTLSIVQREIREERRKIYASCFARLSHDPNKELDDKIFLIGSLETLSAKDIDVLAVFKPGKPIAVKDIKLQTTEPMCKSMQDRLNVLGSSVSKLVARGLLLNLTGSSSAVMHETRGLPEYINKWKEAQYIILPAGLQFLEILETK